MHSYKSFSRNNDNIGDITAKGEAQIAVIDLLGLLIGVNISKVTQLSKAKIVSVFIFLSMVDLLCVYNEIRRYVLYMKDQLLLYVQPLRFRKCSNI